MAMAKFSRAMRCAARATPSVSNTGAQRVPLEDSVGGGLADIGRRGRRQRGVSGAQRRGIVETITDHQHLAASGGELRQAPNLVGRQELGSKMLHAEIAGHRGDDARPVPG